MKKGNHDFVSVYNKQMCYIEKLGQPKDDIERSKYHYLVLFLKCSLLKRLFLNVVSIPMCIFTLVCTLLHRVAICKKKYIVEEKNAVRLLLKRKLGSAMYDKKEIPQEVIEKYGNVYEYVVPKRRTCIVSGYINREIIIIWLEILKKNFFHFFFCYSALCHLAFIGKIINNYKPKAIIMTEGEKDFCSSIITMVCEKNGVHYIGIMHGIYCTNPDFAFVRFSEYYVWDERYIDNFVMTGSSRDFFRVYNTHRFSLDIPQADDKVFATYYLQNQTEEQMYIIRDNLLKLVKKGKKCRVRPHYNATNMYSFYRVFAGSNIEVEPTTISIAESFSKTENVISLYSTVLAEAYENGIPAYVDDIVDELMYNFLVDNEYVYYKKINGRLSKMLEVMVVNRG